MMENEWEHLMDELFSLVYFGHMSLDPHQLTGEERHWWMKRLKKQKEDEAEAAKA